MMGRNRESHKARPGTNAQPRGQRSPNSLRNNGQRIVIGNHAIIEAAKTHPSWIAQAMVKQGYDSSPEGRIIAKLLAEAQIKPLVTHPQELDKLGSHQGVALVMKKSLEFNLNNALDQHKTLIIAADGISDPHNLGAIIRTSWLAGASALLVNEHNSANLSPAAHKVACGGIEHLPVVSVVNFQNYFSELKKHGFWVYGLSHKGKNTVFSCRFSERAVLVVGAEDKGLRSTTQNACDELIAIPQADAAASYNASVSLGISVSHWMMQMSSARN